MYHCKQSCRCGGDKMCRVSYVLTFAFLQKLSIERIVNHRSSSDSLDQLCDVS